MKRQMIKSFYRGCRQVIVLITLVALLNSLVGCSTLVRTDAAELRSPQAQEDNGKNEIKNIRRVVLKSGEELELASPGGYLSPDSTTITGLTKGTWHKGAYQDRDSVRIELDSVQSIVYSKSNSSAESLAFLGFGLIVIGIFLAHQAIDNMTF